MSTIATPSKTYTLDQFVEMKHVDDATYYNFSILEVIDGVEHLDFNIIEEYVEELKSICKEVELTPEQFKRYKYKPDLLAYDLYKSTQLDFIILLINDTYDPKEFDKPKFILPYASGLSQFLDIVYSKEYDFITKNRMLNNLTMN